MGLDGISINQLRVTQEHNSSELNNPLKFASDNGNRIVNGLSEGQRVNPDKQKEEQKNQNNPENKEEELEEEQEEEVEQEVVIKHDLTKSDKYTIKVNEETNEITIIEKATSQVVQKINSEDLAVFVNYLTNPQGALINRKF